MEDIKISLNENGQGAFMIKDGDKKLGKMVISIAGGELTVHHTEVIPEEEGKGLAGLLLNAMTAYARENKLKVIPLCAFVFAKFKRHPEQYTDIWKKD